MESHTTPPNTSQLSKTSFATAPLATLLETPMADMDQATLVAYISTLRQRRSSPPTFNAAMAKEEEESEDLGVQLAREKTKKTPKAPKAKSVSAKADDLLKDLGLA